MRYHRPPDIACGSFSKVEAPQGLGAVGVSVTTIHRAESRIGRTGGIAQQVNRYTYRAEWCSELSEYVGRCLELPWLSQSAPTLEQAIAGIEHAADDYIAEHEGNVPPPLTERRFSGRFVVRTSPMLHVRLAVEAAEQNVSMNQWVVQKLADRPPVGLFDL